ncbi:MAG: insulinase family protein [Saprospiraceae bacterium]|nr:insulinase family protein [Saprospiraceae bacterium]
MLKSIFFLVLPFTIFFLPAPIAQTPYETIGFSTLDGQYTWEEASNDPTRARFYTLQNGLTVILVENHLEPRIMALITTKAGSKNDPADNTGLAHYLEHMLFKGTDKFGTLDYAKEKIELDRIDALYELYRNTTDPDQRKAIYKQIDSVSQIASTYAIANEYDKLLASIGSNMTNAFTSFENTTYMENFPSNNLEKFLTIQKERFRNPVLRLFHTELEAVYEEKNMSLDRGGDKVYDAMFASLFKNHPYGTQTTIGTIEHLKNPSLNAIRDYYRAYYVPNNMAIILAGDFNSDETIRLVDRYFSSWKPQELPEFTFVPEKPRTKIEEITVKSPDEESVAIGFHMPSILSKEAVIADLVSAILYNGKSGLIDKNLVKQQKVLEAYGFNYLLKDYGIMYFGGRPLESQTLQQVRDLILREIDNLKSGNFEESLIAATVNNLKVQRIREQENAMNMAFVLHDQFVSGKSRADYLASVDAMGRITKADVVAFANKWFGKNYSVVYKLSGEDPDVKKVEKPEISPVEVNRNDQSDFLRNIVNSPNPSIAPVFLDYEKDIFKSELQKDLPVWSVPNRINNLFTVYYVLDMGERHNKKLPLAIDYLQFIGTSTMTNEEVNKRFYELAVDFNIYSSADQVYVSLSGLQENMKPAIKLLESLLNDPKPDNTALQKLIASKIKSRNDDTLNKGAIFWNGLNNYVQYGPVNPFNDVLNNKELQQIKAEELTSLIQSLPTYKHRIYYYGPMPLPVFTSEIKSLHKVPATLRDYPQEKIYPRLTTTENTIYFVHYEMVQAEVRMHRWDETFNPSLLPLVSAFNEYYGGGMGSVVFQDIRESRALAYSAWSAFQRPAKKSDPFSASFYVGTQSDKLPDALAAVTNLVNEMPSSEKLWSVAKRSIRQGIETNRITQTAIINNYQSALRLGMDYDVRKDIYSAVDTIQLDDVRKFHKDRFANKTWTMQLIGSRDKIDFEALKPYGKVVELSLKDIFGYEVEKEIKP